MNVVLDEGQQREDGAGEHDRMMDEDHCARGGVSWDELRDSDSSDRGSHSGSGAIPEGGDTGGGIPLPPGRDRACILLRRPRVKPPETANRLLSTSSGLTRVEATEAKARVAAAKAVGARG